jgi:hypothetical protein
MADRLAPYVERVRRCYASPSEGVSPTPPQQAAERRWSGSRQEASVEDQTGPSGPTKPRGRPKEPNSVRPKQPAVARMGGPSCTSVKGGKAENYLVREIPLALAPPSHA